MRAARPSSRSAIRGVVLVSLVFNPIKLFAAPTTQQWIERLGAQDPMDRAAAEIELRTKGAVAIDPLQAATADDRPEVSERARRILRRIQISMLPGQPPGALTTAEKYLDEGDPNRRKSLLNHLFEKQPQVNPLLARLVVLESDDDARHQILYRLGTGYRGSLGRWLTIDQDQPGVLRMLNGASEMWGQDMAADNAAALGICGILDQQIRVYQAEQANGDTDEAARAARQLCFFYRWKNQPELAMKAARDAHEPSLIFLVLGDEGKWDQAALEADDRWHDPVITTSMRAGYQRLAGHGDKAIQTMQGLSSVVVPDAGTDYTPSKFFLLNDLPERGMELLVAQHPVEVFQMHVARGEIEQAIDVGEKYSHISKKEGSELGNQLAELRRQLEGAPAQLSSTQSVVKESNWAWHKAVDDLTQRRYWEAALEFSAMWQADQSHYDWLYLQGYAMKMAGDVHDGQEIMQRAEMVPLGEPKARCEFAGQLEAAGLVDEAEAQRQMGLRGGSSFDELGFTQIQYTIMLRAIEHSQWQQAADASDRLCLMSLSVAYNWKRADELLLLPAQAHLLKARRDRERGDLKGTLEELKMYQKYLPASTDIVLEWTPLLDDLERHDEADLLFKGVYGKLKAICDQYPKSILYQNQLAWMCACCGRKLDEALARAQAVVASMPNDWQKLDTLAEIHFRRGERQVAVDLERRAAGLSNDPYLARQLKRFENAAIPSTTQPGVAPE